MLLSCHAGYSIKRRNRLFIVHVLSFVSTIASTRQVTNQLLIEPLSSGFKRRERSFSHIVCDSLVKMSLTVVPMRAAVITEIPPSHTDTVFTFTVCFSHDGCLLSFSTDKSIQRGKFEK